MNQSWKRKKLDELCELITDGTHSTPEYLKSGIPFLSVKNLTNGIIDFENTKFISLEEHKFLTKRCNPAMGDILYTKVGTTGIAKVVDIDKPFSIFVSVALLKIKHDLIFNRYLEHYLNSPIAREQAKKRTRGMANKNLVIRDIKEIEILYPEDLCLQKRMVEDLDEIFEKTAKATENAEKNLQNARELFKSCLHNVFNNPGDGWEEKTLGDIGKVSMCKRVFKEQTTIAGDIPFYKIGTFGKEPDAYISKEIYDKFREKFSYPKKGDILISASGTIGRRVRYDGEPAYFQDSNIVWIDNDEKHVLNDYLYHFYGACNWSSTKGATISRLYNDNLKQIKVVFPKVLTEQRAIVVKLDALSAETKKLETIYQQKLADLEELKKSVLHKAFNGELVGACS